MLCNQTTSYFGVADVITCSSTRSKKSLPYLLVLAAQNSKGDKFTWLLNLYGHTFGNTIQTFGNTIQLLVTVALVTSVY